MKHKQFLLLLAALILMLSGCGPLDEPPATTTGGTLGFDYSLSSVFGQVLGQKLPLVARGVVTYKGYLEAENLDLGVTESFSWYAAIDEETFQVTSSKTLVLPEGTYNLTMLLEKDGFQYYGSTQSVTLADGQNDVGLTLHPVIGETVTTLNLTQVAALKWHYPAEELAAITEPKLGVIIDTGAETVLIIDKASGYTEGRLNLSAGAHNIKLKMYDGNQQIGRSVVSEEAVTIVPGQGFDMNIVPLHSETSFALAMEGGDAPFRFVIPADIITESGGVANLRTVFTLVSTVNGTHETELTLTAAGLDYEADITFPDFYYDTVSMALSFTDITTDEEIAYGFAADIPLTDETQSVEIPTELRNRSIVGGNLKAVLGVNVFNADGLPVASATISVDGVSVGLTNSGTFGTQGYLKLYVIAGTHTISAEKDGKLAEVTLNLAPGEIANADLLFESPVLSHMQSIPTNGAKTWESFTIGTDTYLAVANYQNDSTHNIDSKIYKWNGMDFSELQTIPTYAANDWESLKIGTDTYLAVANSYNGLTHNIDSLIYKWNGTNFAFFQAIPTNGAMDWESFTIGTDTYLAVANHRNDSTRNIDSRIYKWNGTDFSEAQAIPTNGTYDWEAFTIGTDTYLAVANYHNETTLNIDSKIYKWNGSDFSEIQAIPTNGAYDWESFTIGTDTYLAVANFHNGSYNLDSKIYKWNGTDFSEVQAIPTNGAMDWESFTIGTDTYLAVANFQNDTTVNIDSKIYKWNGYDFAKIQSIPTMGALDMEPFTIDGLTYLAIANYNNDVSCNINSFIYVQQ